MRVVTLSEPEFDRRCRELELMCREFAPDLIIGIARGGAIVAGRMFASIPHIEVALGRRSTPAKERLRPLIEMLPQAVNNFLRKAESALREKLIRPEVPHLDLSPATEAAIAAARSILIVDDAVDSGSTLAAVLAATNRAATDGTEVRSAAITVTTPAPIVFPDRSIFSNRTLVRFPWASKS